MNTASRIATPANFVRATVVAALVVTAFATDAASFTHAPAARTSVTASGFGWENAPASSPDSGSDPNPPGSGFGWE